VRLVLDDKPVGASEANERGWFTVLDLSARAALDVGVHTFRIETQSGGRTLAVEGRWPVTRPAALTDAMFRWSRSASAWRVDWRIPGGGLQTTVVFDQPSRAVAS
jgi:hypothetical protein